MWWNTASVNGFEAAGQIRDDTEKEMTREQIADATRRASFVWRQITKIVIDGAELSIGPQIHPRPIIKTLWRR